MGWEAFKEKIVGFAIVAGAVIAVLAFVAMATFAGGGIMHGTATRTPETDEITDIGALSWVPVVHLVFVFGLLMMLGGIGYGLWTHHHRNRGARLTHEHARVLARYGYTRDWHMLTADWELEQADDPRHYVKLRLPTGEVEEFECSPETFFHCGEGMEGEAQTEGKWLGRFVPYIGIPGG